MYEQHTRHGPGKQSRVDERAAPPLGAGKRSLTEQLPILEKTGAHAAAAPSVTAGPATRFTRDAVLGKGTAAEPGLAIPDLEDYIAAQADWFTDPTFSAADRAQVWRVVRLLHDGGHVSRALRHLHVGELAALPDLTAIGRYLAAFDTHAETAQLSTPSTTLADAVALGQAIFELEGYMPAAVLRHVVPIDGIRYLAARIIELRTYYAMFQPTIEHPLEWVGLTVLLAEGIAGWSLFVGWVRELHQLTPRTRELLRGNILDTGRTRPVLLVVLSTRDWNHAFLQADNLRMMLENTRNLGLIVQGASLADATAQVARVAASHGIGGRLGQVVLAGHGSETTMELSSDRTGAWRDDEGAVAYGQPENLDSKNPGAGTQALIDTILTTLEPATANLVFAGCLINSHTIAADLPLSGDARAMQAQLQAELRRNPSLADYVRDRMIATHTRAALSAANGATLFGSFQVDPSGQAGISSTKDPDVGSPRKIDYVRTGIEPEGALRAALECCADPAFGIAKTTAEIRARVGRLAPSRNWFETLTRVGFELALPPPPGDVDVARLNDLAHRISRWMLLREKPGVFDLIEHVRAPEAAPLFTAILPIVSPERAVSVQHAWTFFDPSHAAQIAPAITRSALTAEDFASLMDRSVLDPHLAAILPIGAPTRGQLVIALAIADRDGAAMPAPVRAFLRAAAGGRIPGAFPAALGVDKLLPNGEPRILRAIGLAANLPAWGGPVDGNVDVDRDGANDRYVLTDPRLARVAAASTVVHAEPSARGRVLASLARGAAVNAMGTTHHGRWTMIDQAGAIGFVPTHDLAE
jgi:hypothetical protein